MECFWRFSDVTRCLGVFWSAARKEPCSLDTSTSRESCNLAQVKGLGFPEDAKALDRQRIKIVPESESCAGGMPPDEVPPGAANSMGKSRGVA